MGCTPIIDDAGGTQSACYDVLQVDLQGLTDLAAALRQEIEDNLKPHIPQLLSAYSLGASFGMTSESPNVRAARDHYARCLAAITRVLAAYVNAGNTLAAAAEDIAQRYHASDAMAEARASEVWRAIDKATKAPTAESMDSSNRSRIEAGRIRGY
jgi:hypothetical protein